MSIKDEAQERQPTGLSYAPNQNDIEAAHERIKPHIHNTPVMTCQFIDDLVGATIFFKCENFQKVGAFKARGAMNAALSLSKEQIKKGLATHSSGNHAQAVALAARNCGVKAHIVMPTSAPKVKKDAVLGYGARVIDCEPIILARESTLKQVVESTGAIPIHPFDDFKVIAGQATAAKELLAGQPELDCLIVPVGGGGLISGTALAAKYFSQNTQVFGAEPDGADDAYRSFRAGKRLLNDAPQTIADGLLTNLGVRNFNIVRAYVKDILPVSDHEISQAMRMIWERMKIIIEPSCAVPVASLIKNKPLFAGKNIGVILTGGNVDIDKLPM